MRFLAGDIGGTYARLQLMAFVPETGERHVLAQQRYQCQHFASLEAILKAFLHNNHVTAEPIESACLGLPGPVEGSVVHLTNLPWQVDARQIERVCAISRVHLINDFHAAALGVQTASPERIQPLYSPQAPPLVQSDEAPNVFTRPGPNRHSLVVGAGTGLGVAAVFHDGVHAIPVAHEGGHMDFAPISDTQQALLFWLWQRHEHVSYERVLSGAGLETLYQFFALSEAPNSYDLSSSQNLQKTVWQNAQNRVLGAFFAAQEDVKGRAAALGTDSDWPSAAEIAGLAQAGDAIAERAIIEFVTIYGAFVGSVALIWNAAQGVYLAGGIAGKLQHWLRQPFFSHAYLHKGRMSDVLASRPVYLLDDEALGVRGAMHYAVEQWQPRRCTDTHALKR
jgi:glucokinase